MSVRRPSTLTLGDQFAAHGTYNGHVQHYSGTQARVGQPLPRVTDALGKHLGHVIPVEGRPVFSSPQQETLHALRRSHVESINPSTTGTHCDDRSCPSHGRPEMHLEKALGLAAGSGQTEIVEELLAAGAGSDGRVFAIPPLAVAAASRQTATAKQLHASGYDIMTSCNFLNKRGEHEAAAWLGRL